jgi:hypothetical protein
VNLLSFLAGVSLILSSLTNCSLGVEVRARFLTALGAWAWQSWVQKRAAVARDPHEPKQTELIQQLAEGFFFKIWRHGICVTGWAISKTKESKT